MTKGVKGAKANGKVLMKFPRAACIDGDQGAFIVVDDKKALYSSSGAMIIGNGSTKNEAWSDAAARLGK